MARTTSSWPSLSHAKYTRDKSWKLWTPADQRRAMRQGWSIAISDFLDKQVRSIQRLECFDTSKTHGPVCRFPNDSAAAAYVVGRAEMGDLLARKALKVVDSAYRTIINRKGDRYIA